MTDLSKGIIEIDGFEISKDVTPKDVKSALDAIIKNHVSIDDEIDLFRFSKVKIFDRFFNVKIYFVHGKLSQIRMDAASVENHTFESLFKYDCNWIKTVLGQPSCEGKYGIVYKYSGHKIGVTYQLNDGRCGTDEFIDVTYERG